MNKKASDPLSVEHANLLAMWAALSSRLDALSHESYTPRVVMPGGRGLYNLIASLITQYFSNHYMHTFLFLTVLDPTLHFPFSYFFPDTPLCFPGASESTTNASTVAAAAQLPSSVSSLSSLSSPDGTMLRSAGIVEETLPLSFSDADRLAPQEVAESLRALPSDDRVATPAERKRVRREHKAEAKKRAEQRAGRQAETLREEREMAIRITAAQGEDVDTELINSQSREKATQLSYTQARTASEEMPVRGSHKAKEAAQKQAALSLLARQHAANITLTGQGVGMRGQQRKQGQSAAQTPSTSDILQGGTAAGLRVSAGTAGYRTGVAFLKRMENEARKSISVAASAANSSLSEQEAAKYPALAQIGSAAAASRDEAAVFGKGWGSRMKKGKISLPSSSIGNMSMGYPTAQKKRKDASRLKL